jgi:hypothetical protein
MTLERQKLDNLFFVSRNRAARRPKFGLDDEISGKGRFPETVPHVIEKFILCKNDTGGSKIAKSVLRFPKPFRA